MVPGGRFNEIYYWDSYFTMLGLEESGRHDLTVSMLDNFAWLIDQFGHVPNGNRSYYLSRSQPPFFAAMVELAAVRDGDATYRKYLPQLRREYEFWMEGAASLAPGAAHRRVVRSARRHDAQSLLGRSRHAARGSLSRGRRHGARIGSAAPPRSIAICGRPRRAAGISARAGWPMARRSRRFNTTDFVPPDLNSLLYQLELTIAKGCDVTSDAACAKDMRAARGHAQGGRRADSLELRCRRISPTMTGVRRRAATASSARDVVSAVFQAEPTPRKAHAVATTARAKLLQPHGLATTTVNTGEQWDAPNGWAPLQWIAIGGLRNYGEEALAGTIAQRWVAKNLQVYRSTGKLVEKYDVTGSAAGGGGEYPLQDGFGWTNGVLRKLLAVYPKLAEVK